MLKCQKNILFVTTIAILLFSYLIHIQNQKYLKNRCINSTICIYNEKKGVSGSGVIVRSEKINSLYYNVVITSAHLTSEDKRLNLSGYEVKIPIFEKSKILYYEKYPCFIYETNETCDLGVVIFSSSRRLECSNVNFCQNLEIDDKIMKIGYGLGDDLRIDRGDITSVCTSLNDKENLYRMNAFTIFGDSGGPVFYNYKLVGITCGIRSSGILNNIYNMSYARPINDLKNWKKELNNIEFAYDHSKKIPKIPIYFLEFNNWTIK